MSLAVRCPNQQCGRLVRVSAELRGQRIACPACGAALRIPAARKAEPAPANLDDTPPDLDAIPDISDAPSVGKPAPARSKAEEIGERVADTAAGATTAMAPVIKLLLAVVLLGGLVWVSTQYLFPMLWARKPAATGTLGDLTKQEEETRRREAERKSREKPIDDESRAAVTAAIDAGEVIKARELLKALRGRGTVAESDLQSLDLALRNATAGKVSETFDAIDRLLDEKKAEEADALLVGLGDIDAGAANTERGKKCAERIRAARIVVLLADAQRLADADDFDAALATLERARLIDKADRRIDEQRRKIGLVMQSGIQFKVAGGVKADVYLDDKRLGDTSRTVWRLPPHKRLTLLLRAEGRVPREVRETPIPDASKPVSVELAPAVPDALWTAHLLKDDPSRWLALRSLDAGAPAVAAYLATVEARCKALKPNEKKRAVWQVVRRDGDDVTALEYTELGQTVRYIELTSGKTIKGTKGDIASARRLDPDDGATRWLSALGERARAATGPCAAIKTMGDFVEIFPERMDLVLKEYHDDLAGWTRDAARLVNCATGAKRDDLPVAKRVAAEMAAWKAVGAKPPDSLVQQSKN